jgi:hypothetical protein
LKIDNLFLQYGMQVCEKNPNQPEQSAQDVVIFERRRNAVLDALKRVGLAGPTAGDHAGPTLAEPTLQNEPISDTILYRVYLVVNFCHLDISELQKNLPRGTGISTDNTGNILIKIYKSVNRSHTIRQKVALAFLFSIVVGISAYIVHFLVTKP